jgi:hypothetical protein
MRVVLWDTRKLGASKDFAGGYGVGQYPARGGLRDWIIRRFYTRDRRPVALTFAYLAAVFRQLGHRVCYAEDQTPRGADLYVFCPSLITLHLERQAIRRVLADTPAARVLVVGLVASVMPEAFEGLDVTVVKGEPEQLLWRLDEVLSHPGAAVQLGTIDDLDELPLPDWSPFSPSRFRVGYDFWRFPTALIQASRGCTFHCNYCPYVILDNSTRFRDPEAVVDEIRCGAGRWGFRSFKFRDPLFGLSRGQVFELAERIARLKRPIQFSVETRIDLMPPEVLRALKRAGLTSVTVGVETPDAETLRRHCRASIREDRQTEFIDTCRNLGIRTVAGFMIGFPEDDEAAVRRVMDYAKVVNPTFANFNIVTPYPGTAFFEQNKDRIDSFDFSRYTVYTPVLRCERLAPERLERLHTKCFHRFYFRWSYLRDNAATIWPALSRWGFGRRRNVAPGANPSHAGVPRPLGAGDGIALLGRNGLRWDGPHRHDGASDAASHGSRK